jgi:hypothetical protein
VQHISALVIYCIAPAEVEAQNRELQATAEAAAADTREVGALVEQHRALEAAHKELQASVHVDLRTGAGSQLRSNGLNTPASLL